MSSPEFLDSRPVPVGVVVVAEVGCYTWSRSAGRSAPVVLPTFRNKVSDRTTVLCTASMTRSGVSWRFRMWTVADIRWRWTGDKKSIFKIFL